MTMQEVPDQPIKGIWKPKEKGEVHEGEYVRIEPPKEGKEKFGSSYIILEPTGEELKLPNHEVLNGKMKTLKTGEYVKVEYLGKEGKVFLYKVEHDPDYVPQLKLTDKLPVKEEKPVMADYMKEILTELTFGMKFFSEGLIPEGTVSGIITATCRKYNMRDPTQSQTIMRALLAEGLIFEPRSGFYKVTV